MHTYHTVHFYLLSFDFIVGSLLLRYIWLSRGVAPKRMFPFSWAAIIVLVNLAGLFCDAGIMRFIAEFGGISLVVLLLPAIENGQKPTAPNQSTDPTLASGTPGAGHQSRHP
jgi:hypothetical protein